MDLDTSSEHASASSSLILGFLEAIEDPLIISPPFSTSFSSLFSRIPSWGNHRVSNCNPVVGEAAALSPISWLKLRCAARSPKRGGTNRKRKRRRCCIELHLRPPGKEVQIRQTTAAEVQALRESRRLESINESASAMTASLAASRIFFYRRFFFFFATAPNARIFTEVRFS